MRNLLPNKTEHYRVFADAVEQLFKSVRYGIEFSRRQLSLDQAVMRKHIVDWQSNEDDDALTTASVQYRAWLPVVYDVNSSGTIGSPNSTTVSGSQTGLSLGYKHPGGTQNIIDINTGGYVTRINLNPVINIDNTTDAPTTQFTFTQSTPSATWTIVHDLGFIPNIFTIDSTGVEIIGSVDSVTLTTVVISFSQAVSGNAYLS